MTEMINEVQRTWLGKAALYELLALGLRLPTSELTEAVASGEYAEALEELAGPDRHIAEILGDSLRELSTYRGEDRDKLFHELRVEYTRLFVGAPEPAVSPFAGVWWALDAGVEPLLFVNTESMAVERFMRSCGIGQAEGINEPLDHIARELEFLQYLSLLRAGAKLADDFPEDFTVPQRAYEDFFNKHFDAWSKRFSTATMEQTTMPFYSAVTRVVARLSL